MGVSKVVIDDEVRLDLTEDTVTPESLLKGVTAHNAAGEPVAGTVDKLPNPNALTLNVDGTDTTYDGS